MFGPNPKTTGTIKSPRHQEIPDSPFTANIRRVPSRVRTLYVKFVVDSLDSDRVRPRDGLGHPRRGDPEVPRGLRQGEAQLGYEGDRRSARRVAIRRRRPLWSSTRLTRACRRRRLRSPCASRRRCPWVRWARCLGSPAGNIRATKVSVPRMRSSAGRVAVLEDVSDSAMAAVVGEGAAGEEPAHEAWEPGGATPEQEVRVVREERPRVDLGPGGRGDGAQARDDRRPVRVIRHDGPALHPAQDDVAQRARGIQPRLGGASGRASRGEGSRAGRAGITRSPLSQQRPALQRVRYIGFRGVTCGVTCGAHSPPRCPRPPVASGVLP